MKKKAAKVCSLAMYTGYVESQSNTCLVLTHYQGFNSVQEALLSIRQAFLDAIRADEMDIYFSKCCKESKSQNSTFKFCPECGKALEIPKVLVQEKFEEYFKGIIDGSHNVWEAFQTYGWEVGIGWHVPPDWKNMVVLESAETMIDECENWSYENWINDGDNHEAAESYVVGHMHFMNEAMKDMAFKRT